MPDNRIDLKATKLTFGNEAADDIPTTGQSHDTFPAPGQARFDHMRSMIIALLAHQSSLFADTPVEGRDGSIWYPTDLGYFHYTDDDAVTWKSIAQAIGLVIEGTDDEDNISLSDWYGTAQPIIDSLKTKSTWSGSSVNTGVTSIPVPESLQAALELIKDDVRPVVYIEGVMVDPRNSRFSGCVDVVELLSDVQLNKGDRFTVIVEKFDNFIVDEIVASA